MTRRVITAWESVPMDGETTTEIAVSASLLSRLMGKFVAPDTHAFENATRARSAAANCVEAADGTLAKSADTPLINKVVDAIHAMGMLVFVGKRYVIFSDAGQHSSETG
jgi:hypothetical protein